MEFDIDVKTELCGKVTVRDYSKEYNLYLKEDTLITTSYDLYKYSECVTINSILKVSPDEIMILDVLQDDHSDDIDLAIFNIKEDGYYSVEHFIIPNKKWYDNASLDYKMYYSTIYIIDGGKVYKEDENGDLQECSLQEILQRNIEGTTIKKCKIDLFYTGHLQECYIGYCRKVFADLMTKCAPYSYQEDVWARDFIWMTLNIIDYLIGFKQYMEAYRILTQASGCGGFCSGEKGEHVKHRSGCGCSKA